MSERSSRERDAKPVGGELILPVAGTIFTVYYFSTITEVPFTAQVSALFVGTVLILLNVAFLIRVVLQFRRGEITLGIGRLVEPVTYVQKRLMLLGLTIGYIFLVQWLGFTLTTFLFLCSAMAILNEGRQLRLILPLSATLAIGGWLLFVVAFDTRFPSGPFELLVQKAF